jgi:SprT protein
MTIVQPINEELQQQVIVEVQRYIVIASGLYKKIIEPVDVVFDIKGRAAGIYRFHYKKVSNKKGCHKKENHQTLNDFFLQAWFPKKYQQIRFNPWIFSKYPEDSWINTIPHEVAHYVSDCLYGLKNIKPHGAEWRAIMHDFGAVPLVRGNYDLEGIPVRKVRRYYYRCSCRQVALTSIRHNKVQRGRQEYRCRDCSEKLILVENYV